MAVYLARAFRFVKFKVTTQVLRQKNIVIPEFTKRNGVNIRNLLPVESEIAG
jgi:hypothetical protein